MTVSIDTVQNACIVALSLWVSFLIWKVLSHDYGIDKLYKHLRDLLEIYKDLKAGVERTNYKRDREFEILEQKIQLLESKIK